MGPVGFGRTHPGRPTDRAHFSRSSRINSRPASHRQAGARADGRGLGGPWLWDVPRFSSKPALAIPGHTATIPEYGGLLEQFIRDVRRDLKAPALPFVIGVMGIDGLSGDTKAPMSHFRQAQTSPALLPEFKGTVVAVPTAPFWSEELAAIDRKHEQVGQEAHLLRSKDKNRPNKDRTMTEEQQKAWIEAFEARLITPEEAALWKRGASNGGYHYLGCAKTLALAGQAFAKANAAVLEAAK